MPEYIDKQELLKKIFPLGILTDMHYTINAKAVKFAINSMPTTEIVHCKECKHLMFSDCYGECSKGYMGIVSPNDYCNYGERKDK